MNRWILPLGVATLAAVILVNAVGRSQAQQATAEPLVGASSDTAIQRKELLKLQEEVRALKAGADARAAYLQQQVEQLTKETDDAVAGDNSIAANRDAETLLEQRVKALHTNNVGSADDRMRADAMLAETRIQIAEREELLRTRYRGAALPGATSELVKTLADVHEKQAELDFITSRLAELNAK